MSKKFLIFVVAVILILGGWAYYQLYIPLNSGTSEKIFTIERGSGLSVIASQLKQEGLIKSKTAFSFYVFISGGQYKLKTGEYSISSSMSISEIANKIIKGDIKGIKITIIEGWNINDIAKYLDEKGIFSKESFLQAIVPSKEIVKEFDFLIDKPEKNNLEGYLFPDTYWITDKTDVNEFVRMMLNNFNNKVTPEMREEIYSQEKMIFEIVTMASIIEKEVATEQDRQIVSGIFWRRLESHIPLQSCATVAYALGIDKWRYTINDTQVNSPYNTYKYAGLPAGPISNPGISAINAAIHPKETGYLYFLSKPDGETVFSRTLKEHNLAIQRYLK
ncbi:MAG: endolytic transglycosylase MltG [Candidatus Parcubacteria bacterium]|nr:endolytic transglycosylase MltG [Candidatus Parcubacteria bacterium]